MFTGIIEEIGEVLAIEKGRTPPDSPSAGRWSARMLGLGRLSPLTAPA